MAENSTPKRAWQIDRALRLAAIPRDRRIHGSEWYTSATVFPTGDDLIQLFWYATVPGSGAPEIPYVEMVQSLWNQGYDVAKAEALLPEGIRLAGEKRMDDLRALDPFLEVPEEHGTAVVEEALHHRAGVGGHPVAQRHRCLGVGPSGHRLQLLDAHRHATEGFGDIGGGGRCRRPLRIEVSERVQRAGLDGRERRGELLERRSPPCAELLDQRAGISRPRCVRHGRSLYLEGLHEAVGVVDADDEAREAHGKADHPCALARLEADVDQRPAGAVDQPAAAPAVHPATERCPCGLFDRRHR